MRALWLVSLLLVAALAGCSDKGGKEIEDIVPEEITERDVERLEDLVSSDPRAYLFPGQAALAPVLLYFNDTLDPGTGVASTEYPNDDGYTDFGGAVIPYDLSQNVPVGQPVEIRVKLKWYGDPGSSADLDILFNVPGTNDAYTPSRFDESMNWNIITKFRVANAVRIEGEPFEVGIQATNGKNIHPDGMRYSLQVELRFAESVLAPGVAYGIEVPEGASGLLFQSEPLIGDESIKSEVVLVDPDGFLARHFVHDDIVTETLFVPVEKTGEYVVYSPRMQGGFLRIETDVPNPDYQARILPTAWTETPVASDVALSPAVPGLSMSGAFDTGGAFPLELSAYLRPVGDPGGFTFQASLNISSSTGWVSTAETTGGIQSSQGRLGTMMTEAHDFSRLAVGAYTWVLTGSGVQDQANVGSVSVQLEAGYRMLTVQG